MPGDTKPPVKGIVDPLPVETIVMACQRQVMENGRRVLFSTIMVPRGSQLRADCESRELKEIIFEPQHGKPVDLAKAHLCVRERCNIICYDSTTCHRHVPELTDVELAKAMYRAYNDQGPNPWKTFDGRTVPSWDEISDQVRGKWGAAAALAKGLVLGKPGKTNAEARDVALNECG